MQEIVTSLLTLLHLVKSLILQRVIVDLRYFQEGSWRGFRQLCEIEQILMCTVTIYGDLHTHRIHTHIKSPTIILLTLPRHVNKPNSSIKRHGI